MRPRCQVGGLATGCVLSVMTTTMLLALLVGNAVLKSLRVQEWRLGPPQAGEVLLCTAVRTVVEVTVVTPQASLLLVVLWRAGMVPRLGATQRLVMLLLLVVPRRVATAPWRAGMVPRRRVGMVPRQAGTGEPTLRPPPPLLPQPTCGLGTGCAPAARTTTMLPGSNAENAGLRGPMAKKAFLWNDLGIGTVSSATT